MRTHLFSQVRRAGRNRILGAATVGTVSFGLLLACGDITTLDQENPGQLSGSTLYVPANAQLIVNGAIADFECAFSRYVVASGLLTDELIVSIAATANYDFERRTLQSNGAYGTSTCASGVQQPAVYTTFSTARGVADTALAHMEGWTDAEVPNRQKFIGQLATYAGYSLLLFGEGMCSAAINLSAEMTPAQLFAEARLRFEKAIPAATAANDQATLNLATLGLARALLNLGDVAGAGTEAAKIPASFAANTSNDAVNARRQNVVFVHTTLNAYSSIDPSFRDLLLDGNPDPRVLVTNTGKAGTAPGTVLWTANKYPALNSPIAVGKYAEAQLIVAEARVAANDLTGAQTAINNARSTRAGMPAYDVTGQTAAQVKSQIIEERRRELFLEGHRLGDIRRYGLALNPATGSTYTTGGGLYGDQSCFPLPDVERINNPNIAH
jgi:starch-binding outer membrane protein, SusD/RagB family